jgi:hypothetical protein
MPAAPDMEPKECPMCGSTMRQQQRQQVDRIPGTREAKTQKVTEWVCPECDYFEEIEEAGGPGP